MTKDIRPTCPYCDFEWDEEDLWYGKQDVSVGDCDETQLTCLNDDCKKEFTVTCIHDLKFESEIIYD